MDKNVTKQEFMDKTRVYGQNKLFSENPALKPLGNFRHMAGYM
jgi:hypothetical protein